MPWPRAVSTDLLVHGGRCNGAPAASPCPSPLTLLLTSSPSLCLRGVLAIAQGAARGNCHRRVESPDIIPAGPHKSASRMLIVMDQPLVETTGGSGGGSGAIIKVMRLVGEGKINYIFYRHKSSNLPRFIENNNC